MNVDLKSIVFGALLGGVFVAAVLTYLAPKSEVGRFEYVDTREVFDTHTGEIWEYFNVYEPWELRGNWHQRR